MSLSGVTRKQVLTTIDGTPEKRMFLAIISDYDLITGICELVDNALDHWVANDKPAGLLVAIDLSVDRQMISISDDAGGVRESDIRLLISPGASGIRAGHDVIGIFGVGGKRAGIALGEHVEIRTRFAKEKSLQVDITNDWLGSDDWDLDVYEIPHIPPGTTSRLLMPLSYG